jgi:hypothetical protein
MNIDTHKAIIEADREILHRSKEMKVLHPFIATHITDKDLAKQQLSRLEKVLTNENEIIKVRFSISTYDVNTLDDSLLIENIETGNLRKIDPNIALLKNERLVLNYKCYVRDYFSKDSSHYYMVTIRSSGDNNFFPEDMTPKLYMKEE